MPLASMNGCTRYIWCTAMVHGSHLDIVPPCAAVYVDIDFDGVTCTRMASKPYRFELGFPNGFRPFFLSTLVTYVHASIDPISIDLVRVCLNSNFYLLNYRVHSSNSCMEFLAILQLGSLSSYPKKLWATLSNLTLMLLYNVHLFVPKSFQSVLRVLGMYILLTPSTDLSANFWWWFAKEMLSCYLPLCILHTCNDITLKNIINAKAMHFSLIVSGWMSLEVIMPLNTYSGSINHCWKLCRP